MMNGGTYDFADLAQRCRAAAEEFQDEGWVLAMELLPECATVLENMGPAIEAMPEIVRVNRAYQARETCLNIADALDEVGRQYAIGKRLGTAQGALRIFAASLRDSQKPKQEGGKKQPLVIHQ